MSDLDFLQSFGDPSRGLPLRHALMLYNSEANNGSPLTIFSRYIVSRYRRHIQQVSHLNSPAWAWAPTDQGCIELYEPLLLHCLQTQLFWGELIAKGYTSAGQMTRTIVPADWWTQAQFNVNDNWAEAHGTRVLDVYVFPAVAVELPVALTHQEHTGAAMAPLQEGSAIKEWYRARVAAWRLGTPVPTQEADRQAARRKFGPGQRDAVDELRRLHAPAAWKPGKRGRKHLTD